MMQEEPFAVGSTIDGWTCVEILDRPEFGMTTITTRTEMRESPPVAPMQQFTFELLKAKQGISPGQRCSILLTAYIRMPHPKLRAEVMEIVSQELRGAELAALAANLPSQQWRDLSFWLGADAPDGRLAADQA